MIYLASKSPRRKELLGQIGCTFEIVDSDAEEVKEGRSQELVLENAERKTLAARRVRMEVPVLGADTVVSLGDEVFGKPRDEADARRMLRRLAERMHLVTTGLALLTSGGLFQRAVTTKVFMAEMTEADIDAYVATGELMDKAGAYAFRDMPPASSSASKDRTRTSSACRSMPSSSWQRRQVSPSSLVSAMLQGTDGKQNLLRVSVSSAVCPPSSDRLSVSASSCAP